MRRILSGISDPFGCKVCGCFITAGTTKCPNCENNPYVPPESYAESEWRGRKSLSSAKKKEAEPTESLESLISKEKII